MPGIRNAALYTPASLVTKDVTTPVSWLRTSIFAPGTTAPAGSVTVPETDPVVICAQAAAENSSDKARFRAVTIDPPEAKLFSTSDGARNQRGDAQLGAKLGSNEC